MSQPVQAAARAAQTVSRSAVRSGSQALGQQTRAAARGSIDRGSPNAGPAVRAAATGASTISRDGVRTIGRDITNRSSQRLRDGFSE